jgi:hypothetical protein
MFVKLIFNTGSAPWNAFKILSYLINQRPATGTNLQTYILATGNTTLGNMIDGTNSAIWNSGTGITALTANTKSVYYKPTSTMYSYRWAVELSGYDDANHKHVVELDDPSAASVSTTLDPLISHYWNTTGTSISSITSEAIATQSVGTASTTGTGTYPTLLNQAPGVSYANLYDANYTSSNMTGAIMYITDNCFMLSFTGAGVKYPNGFPAGTILANLSYYRGIHFVGAYTRIDPWNTAANGIPPFVCSQQGSPNGLGNGFLASLNQVSTTQNAGSTAAIGGAALVADRQVNNSYSSSNTTQPYIVGGTTGGAVNFGCGNRFNDVYGLCENSTDPTSASATASIATYANIGAPLNRTAGIRYLSSDLKSTSYALLPLTWANSFYNSNGGNISDKTGVFWFSGDYFPGDILTSGTKTYVLWPGCFSHTERIALAVPRE